MNIDERIEALTQSVELLAHMHQDNEKKYDQLFAEQARTNERLTTILAALTEIAQNHERRLGDLENGKG